MAISLVASTGGISLLPLYAQNLLPIISRPIQGAPPMVELVVGYNEANTSPRLKFLLSKVDELKFGYQRTMPDEIRLFSRCRGNDSLKMNVRNQSLPPLSAQRSIALNSLRFVANFADAATRHCAYSASELPAVFFSAGFSAAGRSAAGLAAVAGASRLAGFFALIRSHVLSSPSS
jgi:hypothetical protein